MLPLVLQRRWRKLRRTLANQIEEISYRTTFPKFFLIFPYSETSIFHIQYYLPLFPFSDKLALVLINISKIVTLHMYSHKRMNSFHCRQNITYQFLNPQRSVLKLIGIIFETELLWIHLTEPLWIVEVKTVIKHVICHKHKGKLFDNMTFLKHSLTDTTNNANTLLFSKERNNNNYQNI